MTQRSLANITTWILVAAIAVISGLVGGMETHAANKAKFKYALPDIDRWTKYCKREHPKMSLKRCCARRIAVCDNRCKKSRYPNTRYTTKAACLSECRGTGAQCQGLAVLNQCKRFRAVVDRNECCSQRGHTNCNEVCAKKDPENQRRCVNTCTRYRDQSCLKKYSKREYTKIKKKKHKPGWMKAYCAKKSSPFDCCVKMYDRCWASCDGYPDTKEKISACQDQCVNENAACEKQYSK